MDYMDDDARLVDYTNYAIMEQEAERWAAENDSKIIFDEFDDPVDEFLDDYDTYR